MKTWKVRTESGNIGKIKLDEYSVYVTEENITVNIDIVQMSVAIKNELMRVKNCHSLVKGTGEMCILYGAISL